MFISDETLRVIHLVARHQSITTAAEQLNKVPSAISYTIKKAEESLGVELFIRKGRYIEGRRGVSTAARTAIRRWWKKWLPDIVMPPNYTGPQRWQKLNG